MKVSIRDDAEEDLESAFDWYRSRGHSLGIKFLEVFRNAIGTVAEAPSRWPIHPVIEDVHRYRLDPFPFAVVFQLETDLCTVVAVENLRRKPGYWRRRLNKS